MNRRELIAFLASTAVVSWPGKVRASTRMIGFMGRSRGRTEPVDRRRNGTTAGAGLD
jgi:hypothetical protein